MKKFISLIVTLAMICTLCPAFPLSSVMTASAASQTYYYGFEDGELPSDMSLTYCQNPTYTNGIFSFTPQNNDPMITIKRTFSADEINQVKIRMYHNLVAREDNLHNLQVYYKGTNAAGEYLSGETNKLTEGNCEKMSIDLSTDGKFVTYTLDFNNANWAGSTITELRVDPVSCSSVEGDTVKIDYIMLCKKASEEDPVISYEFETDGNYEDFTPKNTLESYTNVSDGCLNYSNTEASSVDINYTMSGLAIETDIYEYIEIIMAHDISGTSATSDLLKIYIEATLADGTVNSIKSDSDTIRNTLTTTSNGEYKRYVFPLTQLIDGTSLEGATITKIRIDPINHYGSASIDSIRIVPHYVVYEPLDKDKLSLSYDFENSNPGCAKGTIKIDFADQDPLCTKNVELIWATGNATDGYTPIENYSSFTTKTGSNMAKGYEIARPVYIPEGTTALIARVTDVEKTFDLVVDIPSSKVCEKTEPKFVAALSSDYHFGDTSTALETPAQKYYDLQEHVQANADTLLVCGDFVQWYGVRSRDEYYHLEYLSGNETYADYAEYDPTALPSQWDMAMEYFQSWDIPVFVVEGNHETPSAGRIAQGHTGDYMKDWMTEWVNYTNNQSMYDEFTLREKHIYENTYEYSTNYDNYVTGADGTRYHVIGLRNLHMGSTRLTEDELLWLDQKLYEDEANGIPVFLMIHVPLQGTLSSSNTFSDSNFKAVVDKHPNTIIISGHTHYSLYSDWPLAIDGAGVAPSYIHTGGVVDTGIYNPDEGINGPNSKANCEIVYAEIYDDKIITRAYDVIKGQYISSNTSLITLNDKTEIADITVTKTASEGNVTLNAACETEDVTFTWYVGGEEAGTGSSLTVPDNCTKFIAVRAADASGSFRSDSFDSIYDPDITTDEGRTYCISISDSDGYNATLKNSFTSTTSAVWTDVAGKSDNVMYMTYNGDGAARTYLETTWTQKNPESKYVVLKYNAMPLEDNTIVYLCTKSGHDLGPRSSIDLTTNEWNNVVTVVELDSANSYPTETYINGKLVKSSYAKTFGSSGIIRLSLATADNTEVTTMSAYIDEFEVYETVNAPAIPPVTVMERDDISGQNAYSAENKVAYIPAQTTAGSLSKALNCVAVDEFCATKTSDSVVTASDRLMYYDAISESYCYYDVMVYDDYNSLFINGVSDNSFTSSDVKLYVNAVAAGDTVVVAQYDGLDNITSVQYTVCEVAGLNEITFTKASDTEYASVLVWDGINTVKPLIDKVDISVK